jgi:hypothetical protein
MGEVVELGCWTTLEVPPDKVLTAAVGHLSNVLVLGYDAEGNEYFASSMQNRSEILWLVERFKQQLLDGTLGDRGS